jgi:hypothetical protein
MEYVPSPLQCHRVSPDVELPGGGWPGATIDCPIKQERRFTCLLSHPHCRQQLLLIENRATRIRRSRIQTFLWSIGTISECEKVRP